MMLMNSGMVSTKLKLMIRTELDRIELTLRKTMIPQIISFPGTGKEDRTGFNSKNYGEAFHVHKPYSLQRTSIELGFWLF